ncbi:hypothetical protein [Streptomyces sp. NBC_00691]|uniref:hypothetical protein n=1 Tax=Streptomyces sp. NBC_00691 TaxID=2903671 RepID=UPI002E360768|nr:hypothetical protein [Streptomyces sp. NBC_00691]
MPASDHPGPVPGLGAFMAADTPEGRLRLGKVTAWDGEVVHLQRPGGGTAWTAAPSELRRPTEDERALIRVLTTPVTAVPRVRQTCPEPPVVLSVDPVPPAVPAPGCATCALAAEREWHCRRTHDHSAAADFRVEIRRHPHDEPPTALPRERP